MRMPRPIGSRLLSLGLAFLFCFNSLPAGSAGRLPERIDEGSPWLYQRGQGDPAAGEQVVELVAVGDIMLGRQVRLEPDPFGLAAEWLTAADLALGNLESPLAPPGTILPALTNADEVGFPYQLTAPGSAAGSLRRAGFDLLGIANNHAVDRGLAGLADTSALLAKSGISVMGAGQGRQAAYRPVYREIDGVRLAFLAVNVVAIPRGQEWSGEVRQAAPEAGWALAGWDADAALAAVRQARQRAQAVIVSIHWGYEYETRSDAGQRRIAERLAEAGASLVIGHHPHVVQETQILAGENGDTFIAYSLGNFVFDQEFGQTGQGLALQAFFDRQGLRGVRALPVRAGKRPALLPVQQAGALLERIEPRLIQEAFRCSADGCRRASLPSAPIQGGIFSAGQADLRGNGQPEALTLSDGELAITAATGESWISPGEWNILDLASGDPNRDRRQELVLALTKPDSSGVMLSHPYVLGYRQGKYRLLWGGSAVSEPIVEIELLDVDGDGEQELAVLEETTSGQGRTFSIWRWNGWGFSRMWRSEPGRYVSLRYLNEETGALLILARN